MKRAPLPQVGRHALLHRAVDDEGVVYVDEEGQLLLPGEAVEVHALELQGHTLVSLRNEIKRENLA